MRSIIHVGLIFFLSLIYSCSNPFGINEFTVNSVQENPDLTPAPPITPPAKVAPSFVSIAYGHNDNFPATNPAELPLTLPAGVVDGDFLIMMVGSDNGAAWQTPAGWTALYADNYPSADGANFNTYYKFAAGEPANYTVLAISGTNGAAGWIAAWRGVSATSPVNNKSHATYYQTDGVSTKTLTAPTLTTTEDKCTLVFIGYVDQNTTAGNSFAVPMGFTSRGFQQDGNFWVTSTVGELIQNAQGATGAQSAIWDNGVLNSNITSGVGAILVALTPQ